MMGPQLNTTLDHPLDFSQACLIELTPSQQCYLITTSKELPLKLPLISSITYACYILHILHHFLLPLWHSILVISCTLNFTTFVTRLCYLRSSHLSVVTSMANVPIPYFRFWLLPKTESPSKNAYTFSMWVTRSHILLDTNPIFGSKYMAYDISMVTSLLVLRFDDSLHLATPFTWSIRLSFNPFSYPFGILDYYNPWWTECLIASCLHGSPLGVCALQHPNFMTPCSLTQCPHDRFR